MRAPDAPLVTLWNARSLSCSVRSRGYRRCEVFKRVTSGSCRGSFGWLLTGVGIHVGPHRSISSDSIAKVLPPVHGPCAASAPEPPYWPWL